MTEKSLFRTTLIALGATILGPLLVSATNIAGNKQTVSERQNTYLASAKSGAVKKDEPKKSEVDIDSKSGKDAKDAKKDTPNNNDKTTAPIASSPASAGEKKAGTYTVKAGDTYGCIAEKYYGSYDQWSRVYANNAGWPGFNEYDLAVGAVLQMPAVSSAQALPATSLCNGK